MKTGATYLNTAQREGLMMSAKVENRFMGFFFYNMHQWIARNDTYIKKRPDFRFSFLNLTALSLSLSLSLCALPCCLFDTQHKLGGKRDGFS